MGLIPIEEIVSIFFNICRFFSSKLFENGLVIDQQKALEIVYYLKETRYRVITPKRLGVRPILQLFDLKDQDVTIHIKDALGPYGNFHGIPTTPLMLGYPTGIKVLYRKGRKVVLYGPDEIILIEND